MGNVPCCKCGVPMTPNAANICFKCLRSEVDKTEEFVWKPHSERLKVKVRVQKKVLDGAVLEQAYAVEYVVHDQMCDSCSRVVGLNQQRPLVTSRFLEYYKSGHCDFGSFLYLKNFRVRKGFWDSMLCLNLPNGDGYLDDTHVEAYLRYCFQKFLHERWFKANNFDETGYKITFHHPHNVPQQSGCFGDCGPLMLMFMKTLLHGCTVNMVAETIELRRRARETMLEELYNTVVPFDPSLADDEVTPISLVPFPC
ncbi:60S ribosomal export protein NMD3 [Artemisia annua]|uniref:60S ribosomal export protein NMD3 n=1 Tax=Artemisia annua TaxID=35608 RepID=A0A2U1KJK1_ARTAN|nr:60S ribosomal export protein NMD3 [Artemisia annua]